MVRTERYQIVGGFSLLLVGVLVLGVLLLVLRFRKGIRRFLKQMALAEAVLPPAEITLERVDVIAFQDRAKVEAEREQLLAAGYCDVGAFEVDEMPDVRLAAFHHPEQGAFAVVYDHDTLGVYTDLCQDLEGDEDLTVSNAPQGHQMEHMPGKHKVYAAELVLPELLERFAQERGAHAAPRWVAAEDFASLVEKSYAEETAWRNAKGGASIEEVRRIAEGMGQAVSDEDIELLQGHMSQMALAEIEEACRDRFLEQTDMSAAEWEKVSDDLVVIHERMDAAEAGEEFVAWIEDSDAHEADVARLEHQLERLQAQHPDPRELFAALNESLEGRRYRKLGEVDEPVRADFYQVP